MPPLVSICLPIYNGERFLAEAIESALAQTFTDFEFILADDQSKDDSLAIAQKYAQKDNRLVVWKNESNKGLFANYNETLQRSSGKLIKLYAQDDLWDPRMLERTVEQFRLDDKLALVASRREWIRGDGSHAEAPEQYDKTTRMSGPDEIKSCLSVVTNWIGEPSAVMFPKANAGTGFDTRYYQLGDLELWFRILLNGDYLYLHETLCKFRRHEKSTTDRNTKGLLFALDMLAILDDYAQFLSAEEIADHTLKREITSKAGRYIRHIFLHGEISLDELLSQKPKDADEALKQLQRFKELAFFALIEAGGMAEQTENRLASLQSDLYQTEEKLANVLDSSTWKATTPLRMAGLWLKRALHAQ